MRTRPVSFQQYESGHQLVFAEMTGNNNAFMLQGENAPMKVQYSKETKHSATSQLERAEN